MYTCQKADEYIEKNRVDRADKPEFHLTTPVGWLNDPNGFSIYGGKAHVLSVPSIQHGVGTYALGTFHLR